MLSFVFPTIVSRYRPPNVLARKANWRKRRPLPIAIRFAGYLPYFKFVSGLLLPGPLNLPAVAAVALSYSVFCHEIGADMANRPWQDNDILAPLKGACLLLVEMVLAVPVIAYILSPDSYGPYLASPQAALPAFAMLVLPCCFFFAGTQWFSRWQRRRR